VPVDLDSRRREVDLAEMPHGARSTERAVPTSFDGQAGAFERRAGLTAEQCRAVAEALLGASGLQPGDRLLEIGAGTGMIGRHLIDRLRSLPAGYLGVDLSRGMLEVFRHRTGTGVPGLVQMDAGAPWPFPDRSVQMLFSSRAIHLLPLGLVVDELFRVVAPGGVCRLGWVERRPESVKARMSREMQRRLRERGFAARSAGSRPFLEACRERGAVPLDRIVAARWPAAHSPRRSLDDWRSKDGLGGIVLPPGVQDEVLDELAAWAVDTFGGLDGTVESEEAYVLDGVRIGSPPSEIG
jgi:ubiquinone/menaquinone biosynthesis C-methylase UbiE